MQKINVELSIFFDGQFFTALFEQRDEQGYRVAKRTFPIQPSDPEILEFVLEHYYSLSFSDPIKDGQPISVSIKNPKRRQREASKASKQVCTSTKAQAALQKQREQNKLVSKTRVRENKKAYADAQYAMRKEKRKQKHRGH